MSHPQQATQIDPDLPIVWEDPTTLRVGFDRARARLRAPSPAAQRVVAKLIAGASSEELAAGPTGVTAAVLAALEPALVQRTPQPGPAHEPPPRRACDVGLRRAPLLPAPQRPPLDQPPLRSVRVRIGDDGRELPWLRAALTANQACSFVRGRAPELAIEVLRFLEPLGRTRRWLGAGIPHLVIRFTDDAARIGPLVAADGSPCHGCETLAVTDRDPALPAIAAQLYGGVPSSETPEVGLLVGAVAAHFVQSWRRNATWVHDHQLALRVARGTVSGFPKLTRIAPHPECGCSISSRPRPPPRTATACARRGRRSRTPRAGARRARG